MRMLVNLPVNQLVQFRVINWQLTTNNVINKLCNNSIIIVLVGNCAALLDSSEACTL